MSGLLPRIPNGSNGSGIFDSLNVRTLIVSVSAFINDLSVNMLHLSDLVLDTLTVPRIDGAPGISFFTSSVERLTIPAGGISLDNTVTSILGLDGTNLVYTDNIVDTDSVQTLTNKTINSASNTVQVSGTNINSLINQDVRTSAGPTFATLTVTANTTSAPIILNNTHATTTANQLSIQNNGTNVIAVGANHNTSEGFLKVIANQPLVLYTNNTERLRIANSGRITLSNTDGVYGPTNAPNAYGWDNKGIFGYCSGSGNWFFNTVADDICISQRSTSRALYLGVGAATAQLIIGNTSAQVNVPLTLINV